MFGTGTEMPPALYISICTWSLGPHWCSLHWAAVGDDSVSWVSATQGEDLD